MTHKAYREKRLSSSRPVILGFCIVSFASIGLFFLLNSDPWRELTNLWLITPLAFVAAAFANATAVGGGFVFIPLFIFGYGMLPQVALMLSLGTQSFGMSSGALGWSKSFIEPRYLGLSVVGSAIGMAICTFYWVATAAQIKAVFGWVSIAIAIVMGLEAVYGKDGTGTRVKNPGVMDQMLFVLACIAGGGITAWVSLGIGEVVALWLLFRHRTCIETAIGTGVASLAISSVIGFAFHGASPDFPWMYLAFTVPGVIFGGFAGARGGRWLEARMAQLGRKSPLKTIFAVVVFLDGLVMLLQTNA